MTAEPQVSLIIASRDRPAGLRRLLVALDFQTYLNFEVIVVSNCPDWSEFSDIKQFANIRHFTFDKANISAARNIGIQHAAGEILAFCDDDAVPEPTWLKRLISPFEDPEVGLAGGFVRGRNGISFQWRAQVFDEFGDAEDFKLPSDTGIHKFGLKGSKFVKVQGTNCAFRKEPVLAAGGFDENYRFYLDETDLTLTLARAGWKTAIVPLAEVQHCFEESAQRTGNRIPETFYFEAFSKAYFLKKHAPESEVLKTVQGFREAQRKRLLPCMLLGQRDFRGIKRLMDGLDRGLEDGFAAEVSKERPNLSQVKTAFRRFMADSTAPRLGVALCAWPFKWGKMDRKAKKLALEGNIVTAFRFSHTSLFHQAYFDPAGFWVQQGGVYGKSDRRDPIFWFFSTQARLEKEISRLRPIRKVTKSLRIK